MAARGHMNGRGPLAGMTDGKLAWQTEWRPVGGTRSKTEVFVTYSFWNEQIFKYNI